MNCLSTDKILNKVVTLATSATPSSTELIRHLDVGSGTGDLISLFKSVFNGIQSAACDYTDELMELPEQRVDIVDFNTNSLPYESDMFEIVTCTEVVEHVENYHRLIRDIYRVTKPGGIALFTTPNILNLQSRLRYLIFGFANLFGPLPVLRDETYSTGGHITPISYFYLSHALAETGFVELSLEIDKVQRSSIPKMFLLWPLIAFLGYLAKNKEIRKYKTINGSNRFIVDKINSLKMLLGRTIIVVVQKPINNAFTN